MFMIYLSLGGVDVYDLPPLPFCRNERFFLTEKNDPYDLPLLGGGG